MEVFLRLTCYTKGMSEKSPQPEKKKKSDNILKWIGIVALGWLGIDLLKH